jgi:hypothetical protein
MDASPGSGSLTRFLLDEFIQVLGLRPGRFSRAVIGPWFWPPASRFAQLGMAFDSWVAEAGFPEAARRVLDRYRVELRLRLGVEVPFSGPLLVTSNHPGGWDSLALAVGLGRPDLKIVASGLPFLRGLPRAARHLILVQREGAHARMAALRASIRHLRQGGALLLFPRGKVEPDPAYFPEAQSSLDSWSPSVQLLLDSVPRLRCVMAMVSGVVSRRALEHPLARLKKEPIQRQTLAEFYQIARQVMFPRWTRQTIALTLAEGVAGPTTGSTSPVAHMAEVIASARRTLEEHWAWIRSEALA